MSKVIDKRIDFIEQALKREITHSAPQANNWYCMHRMADMDNEEALAAFDAWIKKNNIGVAA